MQDRERTVHFGHVLVRRGRYDRQRTCRIDLERLAPMPARHFHARAADKAVCRLTLERHQRAVVQLQFHMAVRCTAGRIVDDQFVHRADDRFRRTGSGLAFGVIAQRLLGRAVRKRSVGQQGERRDCRDRGERFDRMHRKRCGSQFARKRTRSTLRSYSSSTCCVISSPFDANTRPPLRRQRSRSYWHGPISGWRLQSAPTLAANSMAVCLRWPASSDTQTYSVLGGTAIGAAAAEGGRQDRCGWHDRRFERSSRDRCVPDVGGRGNRHGDFGARATGDRHRGHRYCQQESHAIHQCRLPAPLRVDARTRGATTSEANFMPFAYAMRLGDRSIAIMPPETASPAGT